MLHNHSKTYLGGTATPEIAFIQHDHAHCASDIMKRAELLARTRGTRLTPVRRRVLEILLEKHQAMGAYDVLQRLATDGFGNQPPVAYRALNFLVKQGLVHRIQQLNAFTACMNPSETHTPAFLICKECNVVAEANTAPVQRALNEAADSFCFAIESSTIEAIGLCPRCQGSVI